MGDGSRGCGAARSKWPSVARIATRFVTVAWLSGASACGSGSGSGPTLAREAASTSEPATAPAAISEAAPAAASGCGATTGAWSAAVDGLRARLVRAGGPEDGTPLSLAIEIEIENISGEALDIHWSGPPHGFSTFRLDDEDGAEVPEPPWRLGGNEAVGDFRAYIAPHSAVRTEVQGIITRFDDAPIVRIGAFWARELPAVGRRILHAAIAGGAPAANEVLVVRGEDGTVIRQVEPTDPVGRTWTGPLDVPGVCVSARPAS